MAVSLRSATGGHSCQKCVSCIIWGAVQGDVSSGKAASCQLLLPDRMPRQWALQEESVPYAVSHVLMLCTCDLLTWLTVAGWTGKSLTSETS